MSIKWPKPLSAVFVVILALGSLQNPLGLLALGEADGSNQESELRIDYHDDTGAVTFIGADPESPYELPGISLKHVSTTDRSFRYLEHFGELLGLSKPEQELMVLSTTDGGRNGHDSVRYQQIHQGVPILAGELIVNTDSRGRLLSISGEISPGLTLSAEPKLTGGEARALALQAAAKGYGMSSNDLTATEPELWILDERLLLHSTRPAELVWQMDVRASNGAPIDELVLVNAKTGGISLHFNQVDTTLTSATTVPTANGLVIYFDLALDESRGRLYGSDRAGGEIDVISTSTLTVVSSISVGLEPTGLDISPDGAELAVALFGQGEIALVNLDTLTVSDRVTPDVTVGPNQPFDVLYGRPGRLYSVGNPGSAGFDYVHVFNTATKTEVGRSSEIMRAAPRLAMTADQNTLYVSSVIFSPQKIYRFDISTDTPTQTAAAPHGPVNVNTLAVLPDGSKVFSSRGQAWSGDLSTQLGSFAPSADEIEHIGAHNSVAVSGDSQITFINTSDYAVQGDYPLLNSAGVSRVTSSGSMLYISTDAGIEDIPLSTFPPPTPTPLPPPPGGDRMTYTANNGTSLPGTFLCNQTQTICTSGADPHADAAHTYAADSFNFFYDHHGRDSIDDAGMVIKSTVHYDSGYANAFWSSAYQQMIYGDAYGFALADDVVAHELTHGVTNFSSNLFYYYQSGAINESFSDMWGEFVDLINGAGDDSPGVRWKMGEDISGLGAIRDMANPPAYGDPDKMTSPNYYIGSAESYWGTGDSGGVHTNSGVNNKAVYLMTDGGSFNGQTVTALGIDKVAAIFYEVQTMLLTSGADYGDLYNALYQGCLYLLGGSEGITFADCQEVSDATDAVEMNLEPVSGYNPEADICGPGYSAVNLFFDNLEGGGANWTFGTESGTGSWGWAIGYATSGTGLLWGNDFATLRDSFAAMDSDVMLPSSSQPYLHFNHSFGFEDPDFDGAWLEYSTNGGGSWNDAVGLHDSGLNYTGSIIDPGDVPDANPNRGHIAFIGDSHGYVSTRYDLSSLAGQSVRFRWRMSTDGAVYDWGWFVDDVRIYLCGEHSLYLPSVMK